MTVTKVEKTNMLEEGKTKVVEGMISVEKKQTVNNKDYLTVTLIDSKGSISSPVWESSDYYPIFKDIQYTYGQLKVETKTNGKYLNHEIVEFIEKEKPDMSLFNSETLKNEFKKKLLSIEDVKLKQLLKSVFKSKEFSNQFFTAPANSENGYNYEGGLLAHTMRMLKLTEKVIEGKEEFDVFKNENTPLLEIDKDLVYTAIIFHDLGKMNAYEKHGIKINKGLESELLEDSYLSLVILEKALETSTLSVNQQLLLRHIVSSTKGSTNWGAVTTPKTVEAMVVSYVNQMDYALSLFEGLRLEANGEVGLVKSNYKMYALVDTKNSELK